MELLRHFSQAYLPIQLRVVLFMINFECKCSILRKNNNLLLITPMLRICQLFPIHRVEAIAQNNETVYEYISKYYLNRRQMWAHYTRNQSSILGMLTSADSRSYYQGFIMIISETTQSVLLICVDINDFSKRANSDRGTLSDSFVIIYLYS